MRINPWPRDAPGFKSIVNINTDRDCVELSMVAAFHHNQVKFHRSRASHYINARKKYFTFPPEVPTPVSFEHFPLIERKTKTSIFIYKLSKYKTQFEINIIRKGSNKNVGEDRHVYLCLIENSAHICAIKNIQTFIQVMRHKNNKGHSLFESKHCIYCFTQVKLEKFQQHLYMCQEFTGEINVRTPKDKQMRFSAHAATEKSEFSCYYDVESVLSPVHNGGSVKNVHTMSCYGYIIVNSKNEIQRFKTRVGQNLESDLIKSMIQDYTELMTEFTKSWDIIPCLTESEKIAHKNATHCKICEKEFTKEKPSHRHHSWTKKVICNPDGTIKNSNYLAALCSNCNMKITLKRNNMNTFAHNASGYDSKFILKGATDNFFAEPRILSKSAEKYIQIIVKPETEARKENEVYKPVYGICFNDSYSFLSSPLSSLADALKKSNHGFHILKEQMNKLGYSSSVIDKCTSKGVFPYSYISSHEKLQETCLPSKEYFFNDLKDEHISDEDYNFAVNLFNEAGCANIAEYMVLYLSVDILLLAEVFENFRNIIFEEYGLDACTFVTAPSLALQCALYQSKIRIDLLEDLDIFTLFETSIRGGLVTTVTGYEEFNTPDTPLYDKNKPVKTGIMIDFNSLYPTCIVEELPYSGFYELNETEIENLNIEKVDIHGEYAYVLLIDFSIPDEVKRRTDDLPLALTHKAPLYDEMSKYSQNLYDKFRIKNLKSKKLIACHESQTNYLIALPLLQLYIELGIIITKVSRVFRFNQKNFLSGFINKNIELRKNSTSQCASSTWKLMNNSIFGKFLFRERAGKNSVRLIRSRKQFMKLSNNVFLKSCFGIDEKSLIMRFAQQNIELCSPLYIGWYILEMSKLKMFSFYYNVVKKQYGDKVHLQYGDTDSLILSFDGVDIMKEMNKTSLFDYMDTSNFDKDHQLYSIRNKSKLGYLKSETGSVPLQESICLQSKCYSLTLADNGRKYAAKGVPRAQRALLLHEKYKEIYNSEKYTMRVNCTNIRCVKNRLYTIRQEKNAIAKTENKRFWINKLRSLAYGHPDIALYRKRDKSLIKSTMPTEQCSSKQCLNEISRQLNLTYKRCKPGRILYNIV